MVHFTSAFYTPGEVTLTWQAPDEGETVTGYKVYRYRWTGGASDSCETIRIATVGSGTTSYTGGEQHHGARRHGGKATRLASAWAGSHGDVLKVLLLRTVVVILAAVGKPGLHRTSLNQDGQLRLR